MHTFPGGSAGKVLGLQALEQAGIGREHDAGVHADLPECRRKGSHHVPQSAELDEGRHFGGYVVNPRHFMIKARKTMP